MPGERREIKVQGGPLRIGFGGVYTVSWWACWSSLTATGFVKKKGEGVERMGKSSHGCLDRNIMLGEQEGQGWGFGRPSVRYGRYCAFVLNGGGWVPFAQWPHPVRPRNMPRN